MGDGALDGNKFDSLVRDLGRGSSRRQVLKGLLGGVGAAVATTAVRDQVAAQSIGEWQSCDINAENPGCEGDLECCSGGANYGGMCLSSYFCANYENIPCESDANCPGRVVCCADGYCANPPIGLDCGDRGTNGDDDDDDDGAPTTTTMAPSADDDDDDAPPADDDDDDAPPADDDDDDDDGGSKPPQGTGSINTLPNTGSGSTASRNLAQLGATLAASAAAVAAARMLRQQSAEDESTS